MPIALGVRDFDLGDFIQLPLQTHVLLEIVDAQVIAAHSGLNNLSVANNQVARAFDEDAKRVPAAGGERDEPMETDQNETAAERRPKCRRTIHSARQHGGDDQAENGIERGLFRQKALIAQPHHDQRDDEHDETADGDLPERERFGLGAQSQLQVDPINRIHLYRLRRFRQRHNGDRAYS